MEQLLLAIEDPAVYIWIGAGVLPVLCFILFIIYAIKEGLFKKRPKTETVKEGRPDMGWMFLQLYPECPNCGESTAEAHLDCPKCGADVIMYKQEITDRNRRQFWDATSIKIDERKNGMNVLAYPPNAYTVMIWKYEDGSVVYNTDDVRRKNNKL